MDHIDRTNSLTLNGNPGAGTASSSSNHPSLSTHSHVLPMIQTASGMVPMIPFEHPHPHAHKNPAPTVKGYKAPMIIAAMFSVQQNVPASLARLTLVHLECDIPLPPVLPHPKYAGLYPTEPGNPPKQFISQPEPVRPRSNTLDEFDVDNNQGSLASSSATLRSLDTSDSVTLVDVEPIFLDEEAELQRRMETSLLTQGVLPLADILYEERNSYYPRTRYCYHPAEYDSVQLLPGPGIVDLPEEGTELPRSQ